MKITRIEVSSRYKKSFRKLPSLIQKKVIKKINVFRESPFDPTLRTHPLSGKDKECWAFWINYTYRIKFVFLSDKEVLFLEVGTHDIYK
ncbi:MAG: type II toxin-antitoxin system mRNA interferase toxin, RelE/StbE family [Parcubacteria group bacterium]|nr:type II toxin-antitoxin system mRNA interferase toxin, RelE/StbE family [Parcubacteria group bacterium]